MKDFKIKYQRAYEGIVPSADAVDSICNKLEKRSRKQQRGAASIIRSAAAVCISMVLLSVTFLPVMAKSIPAVYNIIEKYAPALTDFVLPVKKSDTSHGITMQVEAVHVEENTAEMIVSFFDAEGNGKDLINGKIDMYDSYDLQSYGADCEIGGCSFLEYDREEGKAYFKIDVTTDGKFDGGKLRLSVHQILVQSSEEKQWISLENLIKNPETRLVPLNGTSGSWNQEEIVNYIGLSEDGLRSEVLVMSIVKADKSMAETLIVTGVGYRDGILRIQTCRGNFSDADRHMRAFLVDSEGNERENDFSITWQEEADGERLLFDEAWFIVEESELQNIRLYGIFYMTEGNVEGNWEVTCGLK